MCCLCGRKSAMYRFFPSVRMTTCRIVCHSERSEESVHIEFSTTQTARAGAYGAGWMAQKVRQLMGAGLSPANPHLLLLNPRAQTRSSSAATATPAPPAWPPALRYAWAPDMPRCSLRATLHGNLYCNHALRPWRAHSTNSMSTDSLTPSQDALKPSA